MSSRSNPLTVNKRLAPELQKSLRAKGWKIKQYHIEFTKGRFQVSMEFCIGDFCIGTYYKSDGGIWDLIETKVQIEDFTFAVIVANQIREAIIAGKVKVPVWKSPLD